jgi:hypothetical protein
MRQSQDTTVQQAARAGAAYLVGQIEKQGMPSAMVTVDRSFRQCFTGRQAREKILSQLGIDIGLDMGNESYSAMLALLLLPTDVGHDVIASLEQEIGRCGQQGRFRFLADANSYPVDTDSTGVVAAALYRHGLYSRTELIASAQQVLLAAATADATSGDDASPQHRGVPTVYWADSPVPGPGHHKRVYDAFACANSLYTLKLAQQCGLADPDGVIDATTQYLVDHLVSGRYLQGTRYYPSPDTLLWGVSRLCAHFDDSRAALSDAVVHGLRERTAALSDEPDQAAGALDLAQRIIAADNVGEFTHDQQEQHRALLAARQNADGSWPAEPFYTMGRYPVYFGSAALTTLFAITALHGSTTIGSKA